MYGDSSILAIDPNVWKCPECKAKHSIKEWDAITLEFCSNRIQKRKFRSLKIDYCRKNGSSRVYKCPSCSQLIQGYKITTSFD